MRIENITLRPKMGRLFCLIMSFFAASAFWQLMRISIPSIASSGKNPYWIIYLLFILTYIWLTHCLRDENLFSVSVFLTAGLLAYLGISGFFLETTKLQTFFFTGSPLVVLALFSGVAVLACTFVSYLYRKLDGMAFSDKKVTGDWLIFWLCFGLLIIGWLPFIIMNYPGSVTRDTLHQLIQFSGILPFSASFPLLFLASIINSRILCPKLSRF